MSCLICEFYYFLRSSVCVCVCVVIWQTGGFTSNYSDSLLEIYKQHGWQKLQCLRVGLGYDERVLLHPLQS